MGTTTKYCLVLLLYLYVQIKNIPIKTIVS
jgi:hypothetical protein